MSKRMVKLTGIFTLIGTLGIGSVVFADPPPMWGARLIVHHLSLNTTGFVSWLKLGNPGTNVMTVTCNAIWTLADGTEGSVTNASLGQVDAGGFSTIGESTLLNVMGNPVQLADVSFELFVDNPDVRFVAEKKASDGRVSIPMERFYLLEDPFS